MIQRDLNRLQDPLNVNSKSIISSSLTVEDLQRAQTKVIDLLQTIDKRMAHLNGWIPPTVPFLGL
jgi:hypothetical protein